MKNFVLRAYWETGDSYSTVCEAGLDHGEKWVIAAENEEKAEKAFMENLDFDFQNSIENDENFRFWKCVEIEE